MQSKIVPLSIVGLPPMPKRREQLSLAEAEKRFGKMVDEKLKEVFKYNSFRAGQKEVCIATLAGKDSFALMPTGGGKSLCYQLPALLMEGITVVVSPLIALMQDQVTQALKKGIKASVLNSAQSKKEKDAVYLDLRSTKPSLKLLYVTPELIDTEVFMKQLKTMDSRGILSSFAVDEAHCISEWGHDFRPKFRKLSQLKETFPHIPVMACTATATPNVRSDVVKSLKLKDPLISITSFNRSNIRYEVRYKDALEDPFQDIQQFIQSQPNGSSGIIYCQKRETCEELAGDLKKSGLNAIAYHAGMSDSQRELALKKWANGECPIICGTIAVGMGIDKSDVRFVIHFQIPKSLESFYQESGRGGRDGKSTISLVYYSKEDRSLMEYLISRDSEKNKNTEASLNALRKVDELFSKACCRRVQLLDHFGEKKVQCKNCDFCDDPKLYGYQCVVDFLVKSGSDINQQTHENETPLSIAEKAGHLKVVQYLRNLKRCEWMPVYHHLFPRNIRIQIRTVILIGNKSWTLINKLPNELLFLIFQFLTRDVICYTQNKDNI